MKQPTKTGGVVKRKKTKTTKKKISKPNTPNVVKLTAKKTYNKRHPEYGTSKLEKDFATDILDYLGLTYVYQYKAESIGRYYDFAITCYDNIKYEYEVKDGIKSVKQDKNPFPVTLLIEVDGDWYHSNPILVKESEMNPMQKHNKFVDKKKNEWAALNGIVLLRFWEHDIRNNKKMVLDEIQKYIKAGRKKREILENRKKPH